MGGIGLECSTETLQFFLDGELTTDETITIRHHLGDCPACRQELSRLKLLWFELGGEEENIESPMVLPYIRQQAIAIARAERQKLQGTPDFSLWDAQKLAWQPAFTGVSQIPGLSTLGLFAKTTIRALPAVFSSVSYVAGKLTGKGRAKR